MKSFINDGLRFECQGSGNCCVSRGEYGFVYLTEDDRKNMAKELRMRPEDFQREYCAQTKGIWHLKEEPTRTECVFLKDAKCKVYRARPTQCRTWPFWPEVMNAKAWKKEVADFCPGVGKGKLYTKEEITEIVEHQERAEDEIIQSYRTSKSSSKEIKATKPVTNPTTK